MFKAHQRIDAATLPPRPNPYHTPSDPSDLGFCCSASFNPVVIFACMGVPGVMPIMHKMYAFGDREEDLATTTYEMAMFCFYEVGVVVYTLGIPGRWFPR